MAPARVELAAARPLTSDDFPPSTLPDRVSRRCDEGEDQSRHPPARDRFDQAMISHRAGRLGFDGRYAAMLLDEGYRRRLLQ